VKRTGDGSIMSLAAWYAVRCAIEVQSAMIERNASPPDDRRIDSVSASKWSRKKTAI
jgi:adenylate cyclase